MPPPYAIRIYTVGGGWQDIAIVGPKGAQGDQGPAGAVSVFETAGDPGAVNSGSIWIDTDDTPVPGQVNNPLGPAGGDLAGSYPNPTLVAALRNRMEFGTATLTTSAAANGSTPVTHSLGVVPRFVGLTPVSSGIISANIQGLTSAGFSIAFFYVDGTARSVSNPCYWVAIA